VKIKLNYRLRYIILVALIIRDFRQLRNYSVYRAAAIAEHYGRIRHNYTAIPFRAAFVSLEDTRALTHY
jgi:hypothetical protein